MAKVEANAAGTDLAKVEELVKLIAKEAAKVAKANAKKKELVAKVEVLASKNREAWFGDKKSFNVGDSQLVYKVLSEVVAGENFDMDMLMTVFPNLFTFKAKYNIPAGELRTYLNNPELKAKVEMLDLDVVSKEVFTVE